MCFHFTNKIYEKALKIWVELKYWNWKRSFFNNLHKVTSSNYGITSEIPYSNKWWGNYPIMSCYPVAVVKLSMQKIEYNYRFSFCAQSRFPYKQPFSFLFDPQNENVTYCLENLSWSEDTSSLRILTWKSTVK